MNMYSSWSRRKWKLDKEAASAVVFGPLVPTNNGSGWRMDGNADKVGTAVPPLKLVSDALFKYKNRLAAFCLLRRERRQGQNTIALPFPCDNKRAQLAAIHRTSPTPNACSLTSDPARGNQRHAVRVIAAHRLATAQGRHWPCFKESVARMPANQSIP